MIELPVPKPTTGEVLVAVDSVSLCGTDVHIWEDDYATDLPIIQGHEISGTIVSLGEPADGTGELVDGAGDPLTVGDNVSVSPLRTCGTCWACRHGRANACSCLTVLGCYMDGALAEQIAVAAANVVRVPDGVPLDVAALAEPVSIAMQAVNRGRPEVEEKALVIGCGPVGILATRILVDCGVDVLAVDTVPSRADIAECFGASSTLILDEERGMDLRTRQDELRQWAGDEGPSLVIEATGVPASLQAAVEVVCCAGRVVAVGISDRTVEVSMRTMPTKELDLLGSRNYCGTLSEPLHFLSRHSDLVSTLITHSLSLEDVGRGLELMASPSSGVGKVLVKVAEVA